MGTDSSIAATGTESSFSPPSGKPALQRDTLFDKMKGLGIILVVLGHLLQVGSDFDENFAYRLIYAFHMPLFFFISGYVLQLGLASKNVSPGPFITKKARALVVPFLSWYLIFGIWNGIPPGLTLHDYIYRFVLSPDYGLWFLWVLFLCFLTFLPLVWMQQKSHRVWHPALLLLSALSFSTIWSLPTGHYGIGLLKSYYFYFGAGYFLRYWQKHLPGVLTKWWPEICIVGFLLLVPYWNRTDPMPVDPFFRKHFPKHAVFLIHAFPFVVALLGIGSVAQIAKAFGDGKAGNWLIWLGRYTLDIYVIHFCVLRLPFLTMTTDPHDPFVILVRLVWTIAFSLAISIFFIRRSRIMSFLFLGL